MTRTLAMIVALAPGFAFAGDYGVGGNPYEPDYTGRTQIERQQDDLQHQIDMLRTQQEIDRIRAENDQSVQQIERTNAEVNRLLSLPTCYRVGDASVGNC